MMDVPDMNALMAAMQTKAAADAASDGVVPESLVILVEILNRLAKKRWRDFRQSLQQGAGKRRVACAL